MASPLNGTPHPLPSQNPHTTPTNTASQPAPRRSFHIGTKVINSLEVDPRGAPTGELRYVRDSRYCTAKGEWMYQLSGKGYRNNDRWVGEGGLRRFEGGGSGSGSGASSVVG